MKNLWEQLKLMKIEIIIIALLLILIFMVGILVDNRQEQTIKVQMPDGVKEMTVLDLMPVLIQNQHDLFTLIQSK